MMQSWSIYKIFNNDKKILAGSTTKNLEKAYSYSLAIHTGEKLESIELNRKEFSSKFPKGFKFVSFYQVHGTDIVDVDTIPEFNGWLKSSIEADGMVTTKKGIVLSILTADCLGLLAYDSVAKVIGAAHAGWRGTANNIAKSLIDAMVKKGAKLENIKVALSPSIKSCCYEVSEDVAKNFLNYPDFLVQTSHNKWHLDISIVNNLQLLELGIKEENVEVSKICTSCSNNTYFSYRKECGCSGRFINYITMVN